MLVQKKEIKSAKKKTVPLIGTRKKKDSSISDRGRSQEKGIHRYEARSIHQCLTLTLKGKIIFPNSR
jgi:hypothetical protein